MKWVIWVIYNVIFGFTVDRYRIKSQDSRYKQNTMNTILWVRLENKLGREIRE